MPNNRERRTSGNELHEPINLFDQERWRELGILERSTATTNSRPAEGLEKKRSRLSALLRWIRN